MCNLGFSYFGKIFMSSTLVQETYERSLQLNQPDQAKEQEQKNQDIVITPIKREYFPRKVKEAYREQVNIFLAMQRLDLKDVDQKSNKETNLEEEEDSGEDDDNYKMEDSEDEGDDEDEGDEDDLDYELPLSMDE
jgi:hypothetical protein